MARHPAPVLRRRDGIVRPGVRRRQLPGACAVARHRRRRSVYGDEHRRRADPGPGRRSLRSRRRSPRLLRSRSVSRRFRVAGERAAAGGVAALDPAPGVAPDAGAAVPAAAPPLASPARSSRLLIPLRRRWAEPIAIGRGRTDGSGRFPGLHAHSSEVFPLLPTRSASAASRAADRISCPDPRRSTHVCGTHAEAAVSRRLRRRFVPRLLSFCSHAMAARQPISGRRGSIVAPRGRLDRGQGGLARLWHCPARKGK